MSLRINEVTQAAGINKETLRYYERREDLHVCATSDCCPLPFAEMATPPLGRPGSSTLDPVPQVEGVAALEPPHQSQLGGGRGA